MRIDHEDHRKSPHRIYVFYPLIYHLECKDTNKRVNYKKKIKLLAISIENVTFAEKSSIHTIILAVGMGRRVDEDSLAFAKDKLLEDDTLLIESGVIFDDGMFEFLEN